MVIKKQKAAVGAMLLIIPHIWGTGTTKFKVKSKYSTNLAWTHLTFANTVL